MRLPTKTAVGIATACTLGAVAAMGISSASDRFGFAYEVQKHYSCLPYSFYVVDYSRETVERGDLVQVTPPSGNEHFAHGIPLMKIVAAIEGDEFAVEDDKVYVNGELWGDLPLLKTLGEEANAFDRTVRLKRGEIAVLGVTPSSYDSRYWGLLTQGDVHGIATVIL